MVCVLDIFRLSDHDDAENENTGFVYIFFLLLVKHNYV